MADVLNKKMLIIEDEDPLAQIVQDEFLGAGFSVSRGRDGEEGLRMALEGHPDIILLDIIIPKFDGFEVLKRLRDDSWGKSVKVILLTNLGLDEKMTKAITMYKPSAYIVKTDMQLEELIQKTKEVLGI